VTIFFPSTDLWNVDNVFAVLAAVLRIRSGFGPDPNPDPDTASKNRLDPDPYFKPIA
jgi:hypothetical protein